MEDLDMGALLVELFQSLATQSMDRRIDRSMDRLINKALVGILL
jgi:hypothetical protein